MIPSENDSTHSRRTGLLRFLLLGLLTLILYAGGIGGGYFADDLVYLYNDPADRIFHYFTHVNPVRIFYRPVQAGLMALVQTWFGASTVPVHILQFAIHAALGTLVFAVMRGLRFTRLQATLGAIFMIVAQVNTFTVLSNDCFSQLSGTLLGCLSVWWLYRGLTADDARARRRDIIWSIVAFALALLSKESSAAFLIILPLVSLAVEWRGGDRTQALIRTMTRMIPYVVVLAIYFLLRSTIVEPKPMFGPGMYDFRIGTNIVRNIGMFLFSALSPVSTVRVFQALQERNVMMLAVTGIATLLLAAIVLYGWLRSERRGIIGIFLLFTVASMFPMAMLNDITELYSYNAMPFIAVLVGIGAGAAIERNAGRRGVANAIVGAVGLLFIINAVSTFEKAAQMKENGTRSMAQIEQLRGFAPQVPRGGTLYLVNPKRTETEYSIFVMNGFDVLDSGLWELPRILEREDIEVVIVELENIATASNDPNGLRLTLGDGNTVRPM